MSVVGIQTVESPSWSLVSLMLTPSKGLPGITSFSTADF